MTMTETKPIEPNTEELAAACAAAEQAFQRGDIGRSRAAAEGALAAARDRVDRASEARMLQLLGEIDYDLLAYPRSLECLEAAIDIREQLFGEADIATRYSRACRAVVLVSVDRLEDADADLARATPAGGVPESPAEAVLNGRFWVALGAALNARERTTEARRIFEALLAAADQGEPLDPLVLANACLHFASLWEQARESERAIALNHRMIAIRREIIGAPSLRVALGLVSLGTSQLRLGHLQDARTTLEESAAMLRAAGYEDHPRASVVCLGLAVVALMTGQGPASERWITRAVELETRTFGGAHPSSATMVLTAARMFGARGHHTRAAELAQRAAAVLVHRIRTRPELFEEAVGQAFVSLRQLKRHDAIVRWLEPLLESLKRHDPPPLRNMAPVLNMISEAYAAAGRLSKAEAALRRSLELTEREYGAESEPMQVLYTNLATLLTKQKRVDEAQDAEDRAQQIAEIIEERARSPFTSRWRRGQA
jgi:tetratricopeptide (TPR) repeat protein